MHPRIKELYNQIHMIAPQNPLNIEVLHFLKECGATRTEATITLHQGFNLAIEEVDNVVLKSNIWTNVNLEDVFFETLKYVYYNPDDPNYKSGDDTVQISF